MLSEAMKWLQGLAAGALGAVVVYLHSAGAATAQESVVLAVILALFVRGFGLLISKAAPQPVVPAA